MREFLAVAAVCVLCSCQYNETKEGRAKWEKTRVCASDGRDSICGYAPQYERESIRFRGDDGKMHEFVGTFHSFTE